MVEASNRNERERPGSPEHRAGEKDHRARLKESIKQRKLPYTESERDSSVYLQIDTRSSTR